MHIKAKQGLEILTNVFWSWYRWYHKIKTLLRRSDDFYSKFHANPSFSLESYYGGQTHEHNYIMKMYRIKYK